MKSSMEKNRFTYRLVMFFVLLFIIGVVVGGAVLALRLSENNARVQEAKALQAQAQVAIEEIKPDVIVARSQANINNVVALSTLKDSALIILLIILVAKDIYNGKVQSGK